MKKIGPIIYMFLETFFGRGVVFTILKWIALIAIGIAAIVGLSYLIMLGYKKLKN